MPSWTAEVLFVELIMQVGMTLEGGGGWGVAGESAELWTRTGEFWRAAFTLNGCQDEKAALHYLHLEEAVGGVDYSSMLTGKNVGAALLAPTSAMGPVAGGIVISKG